MRFFLACVATLGLLLARPGRCATTDRHQVQPRRGARHAERAGGDRIQAARRRAHEGTREDRGLSEQPALQGRRGARRPAARLGADARTRAGQVRAGRHSRAGGVRSAVHVSRPRRAAARLRRTRGRGAAGEARVEGHGGPRLLEQRLPGHEREPPDPHAARDEGPQDAHQLVEGQRRDHEVRRLRAADDGVLGGVPGAADRRHRRHRGPAVQPVHPEAVRGAEERDAHLPHDQQLRGGREQAVLGQAAAGHPDDRCKGPSRTPPRSTTRTR